MLDRVLRQLCDDTDAKVVLDALRPVADRDRYGAVEAREMLNQIAWLLDQRLEGRHWIAGADFTLADLRRCPSLFYADWAHEIPAGYGRLRPIAPVCSIIPPSLRGGGGGEAISITHFPLGAPARIERDDLWWAKEYCRPANVRGGQEYGVIQQQKKTAIFIRIK